MTNKALVAQFHDHFMAPRNLTEIQNQLPEGISIDRFKSVVMTAVQQDPALLAGDLQSLFLAARNAAKDGLLPDKREGAFVVYSTKDKDSGQWKQSVQWMPMIQGLRKILARNGFSIRAELVYANDEFEYVSGDDPKIVHKPEVFGDRGKLVGAYAIAKDLSTGDLYRETMTVAEINEVMSCSKSGARGPWGKFFGEMAKKTVARRLIKSLPLNDYKVIQESLERGDDDYDFEARVEKDITPKESLLKRIGQLDPDPEPEPEPEPDPDDEPYDYSGPVDDDEPLPYSSTPDEEPTDPESYQPDF